MEIKKEDEKIVTTMSFSECFFGIDDVILSKEIINRFQEIILYPYQPERLSEKTYYRNEDGTYPPLESCIGSDSLNS